MTDALSRVLVVVPTYDERENLPGALDRLRTHVPDADVLVVDDGSPDGTGELAEKIAESEATERRDGSRRIHVLHRAGKLGLGTAYVAGFGWALERGYDVVVEMDADGSHRARGPPAAAGRAHRRRPRARLPVGAGRERAQLAGQPARAVPRREHVHADRARHPAARRDGRLPRLPRGRCSGSSAWTTSRRRATASRSTWPGARSARARAWSRCPITFVERELGQRRR